MARADLDARLNAEPLVGGRSVLAAVTIRHPGEEGPSGTWLVLGHDDYVAHSTDGVHLTPSSVPVDLQWWNGLAAGPDAAFWVAGEKGSILASTDDGTSFSPQSAPGEEDLYAVYRTGDRGNT